MLGHGLSMIVRVDAAVVDQVPETMKNARNREANLGRRWVWYICRMSRNGVSKGWSKLNYDIFVN